MADEQRLTAEALQDALGEFDDFWVVGAHFGNGRDAVKAVIETGPDVVVYDYWMPGTAGPAASRYLATASPRSRVVLLSWLHGRNEAVEALFSGAGGLVPKTVTVEQLAESVRSAHEGARPVAHSLPVPRWSRLPASYGEAGWQRLRTLSPRELDVLHLLAEGRSATEVARELNVADGTARNHIQSILRKMGASNKVEAVEIARHEGLVREWGGVPLRWWRPPLGSL